jgi:hypothetical protein
VLCVCAVISNGALSKWIEAARLDIDHRVVAKLDQTATAEFFRNCPAAVFSKAANELRAVLEAKVNEDTVLGPAYSDGTDLACSYIATKSYNRSIALT